LEPQRLVFQILCANAAINSLEHLECVHAAAGARDEVVLVGDHSLAIPNNFGGQALTAVRGTQRVRVIRLDDHFVHDRLRLVKIDVEGMEAEVLRGARKLIEKFQPVLYVENHDVLKSEELLRLIDEYGYECHWHLPLFHNQDSFFKGAERLFDQTFFGEGAYLDTIGFAINMICVPKGGQASIEGFYPVRDFQEHPLKREWNGRFLRPPGAGAARRAAGVG
jgi:FkbM family methyltransferase